MHGREFLSLHPIGTQRSANFTFVRYFKLKVIKNSGENVCESTVYSTKSKESLMKDAVLVTVEGDQIRMRKVLGSEKVLRRVVKIDLLNHRLFIVER
ncbi:MAG: putative RNA-binding protein [Candidatus Bathyarchaeota archaeon BA1]|nr:MAG: putative RNA-binding protein [Candidatus Bathyarchaeota archaeon BA1]